VCSAAKHTTTVLVAMSIAASKHHKPERVRYARYTVRIRNPVVVLVRKIPIVRLAAFGDCCIGRLSEFISGRAGCVCGDSVSPGQDRFLLQTKRLLSILVVSEPECRGLLQEIKSELLKVGLIL